jgi:hypothetical protein
MNSDCSCSGTLKLDEISEALMPKNVKKKKNNNNNNKKKVLRITLFKLAPVIVHQFAVSSQNLCDDIALI